MTEIPSQVPSSEAKVPLVSVVMPAYNAADTIAESIASVLQQSFADFELLVIDDGSTDRTRDIVVATRDSRIRLLSFDNAGPSASRNRGIDAAKGSLIAFLDADDLWLPDKLADQVEALRTHPDSALVYSWTDCVDEGDRFLQHGSHVRAEGDVYALLVSRNFIDNGSTPMVRKTAFDAVGLFDEEFRNAEDWDMWLRLAAHRPFVCVPRVQVLYRVRASSSSSNIARQVEQSLQILERGLDRLPATAEREHIKRTATSNLYKYIAVRLVETSTSRADGHLAAHYWWKFVKSTPTPLQHAGKAVVICIAIVAIVVLPPSWLAGLRSWLASLRGRRRQ